MSKLRAGFSLTELLITIAIMGILVSVGYPAYTSYIASAARASAQSDLMAVAAGMERFKASNFTYSGAAQGGGDTGSPAFFNDWSPSSEPEVNKKYELDIASVSASGTSYVLTATPVTGTASAGDGTLYYYSDGRKAWDSNANGSISSSEYCWVC
ncbi:type IV pilin protein [Planctobacterium marinum]|uniref:type IV pilin protein n=1 Tax=Planctobacterium marinum TaxID=1631968 RepID=UPI001E5CDED1|nr:type IV pilin protein [Planctobacterium marinum]MCC2605484.1 prepilin-type N-terminal cleavage/methylation domain-containing protein [Planctobacterium marinum]